MTKRPKYLLLLPLLTALVITTLPVFASTGMSHCNDEDDADNADCNDQPDRVGNDEENDEDAPRDGPGGEDDTPEEEDDDPETPQNDDANCWGKVTSELAEVGNQAEGHPSDHADTVGPRFGSDEECTQD
jgi:hypothetical protein